MEKEKRLQEMSLEELWKLFPISLDPYNPSWKNWAEEEKDNLRKLLRNYNPVVSHIGSTAIPGIFAKPIVDILVETDGKENWDSIVDIMEANGYILMARCGERMSFNKGYTVKGYADKVFHIHFHILGDNDEILFRDYLKENPSIAAEYEKLKLSLLPEYEHDRDGYTSAKTDFIRGVVKNALCEREMSAEQLQTAETLLEKIGLNEVWEIARWASVSDRNKDFLWRMSFSTVRRVSLNSLWILTHVDRTDSTWLRDVQGHIIVRLLSEQDTSKKRIFLQLLREQDLFPDNPLTIKLLDYCFSKINSECEPYAVRCFSLYVAFKICRTYPELITELEEYLNLLSMQTLSPGLKSALRQTRKKISVLKRKSGR